jgi:PAS domain S-box-containing protein
MPAEKRSPFGRRPSRAAGWSTSIAVLALWAVLRVLVFRSYVFPLSYALPLFLCVWTRDKVMLWTMAAAYVVMHTVTGLRILPDAGLTAEAGWLAYLAALFTIVAGALAVHAIIVLRERLEGSLAQIARQSADLRARNDALTRQSDALAQQSEQLAERTEELSEQSEELSRQNEELHAQSEEVQALNDELAHREALLQVLLHAVRLGRPERAALEDICRSTVEMLGVPVCAAAVYEMEGASLLLRGAAGLDEATTLRPDGRAFAALVIEQNRSACLNDASLRPDLALPDVVAQVGFQAVLGAPLQDAGRSFGAVCIYSRQPIEWTTHQFRVAEWLADQAAHLLQTIRLQEALRQQAALIDLTPDAIFVRQTDGTITLWGHGAEALYGWTKEEAIGRRTNELLHTRFPVPMTEILDELARVDRWTGELVHTTKDGRQVVVESRWLVRRDGRGEIAELLESNVDVTHRKRVEQALREGDQRKNEFLATLSHELRNPLAPIRYALELLDPDNEHQSPAKQVIERQLAHLVRLVDDLLDVTRIASNKIKLRKEPVKLSAIVEQAVEATLTDMERAKHSLHVLLPPQPIWLEADAVRLTQVFTNLLSNAARYTPPGGRIQIGATLSPGDVVVSVCDSGVGLSPTELSRVFEMFTQFGEPGHGGLGIGLALVKRLVEQHGGDVAAHSDGIGRGAEFRVRLPRIPAPVDAPGSSLTAPRAVPERRRIIVVDDNVDSAEMMRTLLEAEGHDVHVAYDGPSALAKIVEVRPEIGLLDIGLPGMSGYELAEAVRIDPSIAHIYLIAVTGWGQDGDRQRARASGFDEHLTKPADLEVIRTIIARAGRRVGNWEMR